MVFPIEPPPGEQVRDGLYRAAAVGHGLQHVFAEGRGDSAIAVLFVSHARLRAAEAAALAVCTAYLRTCGGQLSHLAATLVPGFDDLLLSGDQPDDRS
ncbi:hypothetical protein [Kitasatospora sp. NPDC093558]|uniref:hypothetical protein n=1 Tax=Kitasatospora sp. NPDC093558 TaxID=3155201 RepID=UPI00343A1BCE